MSLGYDGADCDSNKTNVEQEICKLSQQIMEVDVF